MEATAQNNSSARLVGRIIVVHAALLAFACATTFGLAIFDPKSQYIVPSLVIGCGFIGVIVGLQKRIKALTESELRLHASTPTYSILSPSVGGILAMFLYLLFLSGLVAGKLFPEFEADEFIPVDKNSFAVIFYQHPKDGFGGYAKLLVWSFIAGYSERFVTNIIGRIEGSALESAPAPGAGDKKQKGGH